MKELPQFSLIFGENQIPWQEQGWQFHLISGGNSILFPCFNLLEI